MRWAESSPELGGNGRTGALKTRSFGNEYVLENVEVFNASVVPAPTRRDEKGRQHRVSPAL